MSRGYGLVRPKVNRVYAVLEVLLLYTICRNTLSNWIKAGLRPVDEGHSQLFRGTELARFHAQRKLATGRRLRPHEFKCAKCKAYVVPDVSEMTLEYCPGRSSWAHSSCPECRHPIQKILNETICDTLQKCVDSNTSLHTIGEENGAAPAGIGTNSLPECPRWVAANERIISDYQFYCGQYDVKTLDAHLSAIRDFEAFHQLKTFSAITPKDASRYRDHLIDGLRSGRARSTIAHDASYLKIFFTWLVQQDGYRRMNKTVCDYFKLPKGHLARAIQPDPRDIPTSEEVKRLVNEMPSLTRVERRDRTIVAVSFLFGTRSNATASLRLGSVDIQTKIVRQDAQVMRIKNGKSQTTRWYPIGKYLETIVTSWIEEQTALGYGLLDALFPPDAALIMTAGLSGADRKVIEPWKTDGAVGRAFERGCQSAGLPYFNPHSARHHLKLMRDDYCKTPEQRKAWSHNMGHENEQTTESNYAKMTDQRRNQIFDSMEVGNIETEEEKDLLLDYHEHLLMPGSEEFKRAERLDAERRKRRQRE